MMAPLHFVLNLNKPVRGFTKARIPAVPAPLVGVWHAGETWRPDSDAVKAALPHYYRVAWDRAGGTFWVDADGHFSADGRWHGVMPYTPLYDKDARMIVQAIFIPVPAPMRTYRVLYDRLSDTAIVERDDGKTSQRECGRAARALARMTGDKLAAYAANWEFS
jgi:hypothetical protein